MRWHKLEEFHLSLIFWDAVPELLRRGTDGRVRVMSKRRRQETARIPVSTCSRREEASLVLFTSTLSIILTAPGKTPGPVPEHALDVVKSEVIPYLCNRILDFITRGKLSISQDLL
jgi:hypothetical protein